MRLNYILFLALKNLKGHKLRTILTAGGVAISVGFVVFLVSLGLGLQQVSTKKIANLEALKIIDASTSKSKIVTINDETLEKFKNLSNVIDVHPMTSMASSVSYKSSKIDAVVYGKDVEYLEHEDLKFSEGNRYKTNYQKEIVISRGLQEQLNSGNLMGKSLDTSIIVRSDFLGKDAKNSKIDSNFTVVGIIDDKNAAYAYIPFEFLQNQGIKNYSGAKIVVKDKEDVDGTKLQIENLGFKTTSIKDTVDQINQFFSLFQVILGSFGAIAIIVACMGMFNTLTITLLEKTREVGFMKALGARKKDIYRLFIFESLLIGLFGSIIGIASGAGIGVLLNLSIAGLAKTTGNQAVEIFYTPLYLVVFAVASSFIISFFTGLYPSRRAATINPLDALRYE